MEKKKLFAMNPRQDLNYHAETCPTDASQFHHLLSGSTMCGSKVHSAYLTKLKLNLSVKIFDKNTYLVVVWWLSCRFGAQ